MKIIEIFEAEADKRDGSTYQTWVAALKHWHYFKQKSSSQKFDFQEAENFKQYLLKKVSVNSASTYWQKFKAVSMLYFELTTDKKFKLPVLTPKGTHREHLNHSEVCLLLKTDLKPLELKQMALFSILTGLRWSDISKLQWSELFLSDGWEIRFHQQKTGKIEVLPISDQAYSLLPRQKSNRQKFVFKLGYSSWLNNQLNDWCKRAGVQKKIAFHTFRHTHAVLQLDAGTDIYTLSKMLGHKNIKTTEIYAACSDKAKKAAANRIKI